MVETTTAGCPTGSGATSRATTARFRRTSADSSADAGFDQVVADLLDGGEAAFRAAYRSIHPGLVRYLGTLVGPHEADDVASETWAQVCRDLSRFRGDGDGFRGWVTTIARHRALDHLRARSRRPSAGASDTDLIERPGPEHAESEALASISTRAALDLISSLPSEQAEAVLLRTVMGLDAKSAGRVLGKRPGAVRTAAYRGLRALRDALEVGSDESGDTFRDPSAEGVT